jgi:hypothetical protein
VTSQSIKYGGYSSSVELYREGCEDLLHRIALHTEKDIRTLFNEDEELTYALTTYYEGRYNRACGLLDDYLNKSIAKKKLGDICD